jgi:sulfatase maturation enzyme AslB (radical SAM superfamily)
MEINLAKRKEYLVRRISPNETCEQLTSFPRYFEIETVNVCNARCPMCTINDWQRDFKPMTDELFAKIAAELIEHKDEVKRVSLYRDGEPLIDKKLARRVAMLKEGGIRSTAISTNVSLLTPARAEELLHAGLDYVILSIDSLQKDVFERIRVRLNFDVVLENALRFIELRNKIRPQTSISVRMIRQEGNDMEWPAFHDYWAPKLAPHDRVYFHTLHNWGGQLSGVKSNPDSREPLLPCVALWSLFVIFCNGDVPLCSIDYNNQYPTGSVLNHSIAELWQSKVMNERRQMHLDGRKACISLCENCNAWDEPSDSNAVSPDYAEPLSAMMG